MGISVEFNPDLCLRKVGTEGREKEECLPEGIEKGRVYNFLKKGQRNFWFNGEVPLRETKGNQQLSKPVASVKIIEVVHFLKEGEVWTKGSYEVVEVFEDDKIHFDGLDRIEKEGEKERPKVGLGVIIINSNKVLLGKRKGAHGEGSWCFPGGHLEMNESFEDCAKREVMEETGLNVEVVDEMRIVTNDFFRDDGKHYVTISVRANYIGGEARVMEPDKCEEWRWFGWDEMPENLFVPIKNLKRYGYNPFER